jgi:hypothetical protein
LSSHSEKSDTAGLGGRGGPYRIDRGHKVHQVSDEAKAQVSKETAEAAKQMAEAALKERLQEIGISETEWKMYDGLVQPIRADIVNLKGLLKAVESKKTERAWIKRQSYGEIDDAKLVVSIESFYIDVIFLLEISYSKTIITSC